MRMITKNKSQSMLAYAGFIAAIITALIMISTYLQRHISGVYQQAGDAVGEGEQKN
jgi:hypothetical protein